MGKEKASLELTLKNILYYVPESKHTEIINILRKYEEKIPDSKLKNLIQKIVLKRHNDYYEQVDLLVKDILEGKLNKETKKVISDLVDALKPYVEEAERTFWDKLKDLFSWS